MNVYRVARCGRMFFRSAWEMRERNHRGNIMPNEVIVALHENVHDDFREMIVLTQRLGVGFILAPLDTFDEHLEKIG